MYFVITMRCCFLDNKQQIKFSFVFLHFGKRFCETHFATKFRCEVFHGSVNEALD